MSRRKKGLFVLVALAFAFWWLTPAPPGDVVRVPDGRRR